jgi:hypothetical protein
MNNLNIINEFKEEFETLVTIKPSASLKRRLDEFDEAVLAVYDGSEEFPNLKQLRQYFTISLSDKTNWGSKEVMEKLTYAVNRVCYSNA